MLPCFNYQKAPLVNGKFVEAKLLRTVKLLLLASLALTPKVWSIFKSKRTSTIYTGRLQTKTPAHGSRRFARNSKNLKNA